MCPFGLMKMLKFQEAFKVLIPHRRMAVNPRRVQGIWSRVDVGT